MATFGVVAAANTFGFVTNLKKLATTIGMSPMYGAGARDPQSGDVELWFPLVEKAYAAHVGSYDILAQGTSVGKVMADFLGRANTEVWLKDAKPDDVWQKMQRARASLLAQSYATPRSSPR